MTHDDLPRGLGIRDEEIDEALAALRAASKKIERDAELLRLFLDLRPAKRLAMYESIRDMLAMNRLARQLGVH